MDFTFTTQDFISWLKHNRPLLRCRTSDEVASLAYLIGFRMDVILPVLSHFEDALQGSSFDNKMKMQMDHYAHTVDEMNGKVFLNDQWRALADKQRFDKDFQGGHNDR